MALTRLSISNEQAELIKELVSNGVSGLKIAKKLKMSQSKVWRNMEIMGINYKRKKECNNQKHKKEVYFAWSKYKNSIY